ncbi:hypothetical protein ACTU3I_06940 [Microbacterium sp. RD1]|uniref:hypothetical protein n=1 Tax=Microbacterium sp. RD1 TaxID=3457313 RepID=UPI003FA5A8E3
MTAPQQQHPTPPLTASAERGRGLLRAAIWVAIGALIAAAIVCVVWVLIGPENGIIGRAFLTILLLAGFAGVAILDASLAPRRPAWFALTSMVTWVVTLLLGAFLVWMPTRWDFDGFGRFISFLVIVLVLQLALLHVRLYTKALARHDTAFTRTIGILTLALVTALTVMLVLPLAFHEFIDFGDLYWRFVVAITILAAVGTALIPLVNALFAPKTPRPSAPAPLAPWPTYVDGVTPLPVMPDGSPDWNAYYTGYPTYAQQQPAPHYPQPPVPQQAPPAQQQPPASPAQQQPPAPPTAPQPPAPHPGYQGFPPPPAPPQ